MFNIGPMEFLVLAIVGIIVVGPDKLPKLARDAANMLRTLREMATGARTQLREELGPEFADLDLGELRKLNPRNALQRAILGDEDLRDLDPRPGLRKTFSLEPDAPSAPAGGPPVSMDKPDPSAPEPPVQRPLGRNEQAPFDADAT